MRGTRAFRTPRRRARALRHAGSPGVISGGASPGAGGRDRFSAIPPGRAFRGTARLPRGQAIVAAIAALCALGLPASSRADLLTVEVVPSNINVTVPPGASGTFELDLLNPTSNTQTFQVAGFQFELRVPAGSGVQFTDATTATVSATYIFAGNSVADTLFGGSLITSPPPPPPTNDLHGFDTVLAPGTFTTLKPGDVYGLGLISFSVDASAGSGKVPIAIIPLDINI
jgi:hypothetical protein